MSRRRLRMGLVGPGFVGAHHIDAVRRHLASISIICAGGAGSGPIGGLSKRERFDWLVAPRSTIIQTSAVHSGRCNDVTATIERLIDTMVRPAK